MIFYSVTDVDLDTSYHRTRRLANLVFQALIPRLNGNDVITLSKVVVPINAETVLALLNGAGGYIDSETVLETMAAENVA